MPFEYWLVLSARLRPAPSLNGESRIPAQIRAQNQWLGVWKYGNPAHATGAYGGDREESVRAVRRVARGGTMARIRRRRAAGAGGLYVGPGKRWWSGRRFWKAVTQFEFDVTKARVVVCVNASWLRFRRP